MKDLTVLEVGSFEVNCSIVGWKGETFVVDPGQDAERIIETLERMETKPDAVLLTHGHFDHINAIPALLVRWPELPVVVTAADMQVMTHPMNTMPPEYYPVEVKQHIEPSEFAAARGFEAIPTPGHTPGGVCYHFAAEKLLLSGDTLFAGSIGRTDLPGGDMATLMRSLDSLRVLPRDTKVIPGHGPGTTIGDELDGNPFLQT